MGSVGATSTGLLSLLGADPDSYRSHLLHGSERTYMEINCYTDILVELLHARGEEPLAAMGSTVTVDFEGDQWTFFKPAPEDLELLYGLDVHEMQPYRPLPEQIAELIGAGRTLTVELDSWFMPDTAATSYHAEHVKSSIVPEAIDLEGERLHYFHATGLHELQGGDYRGIFRLDGSPEATLPPYTELVRFDVTPPLRGAELRDSARRLLRRHLARRPDSNPFLRFGAQLQHELPRLLAGDQADYHAYAFATVRMAGSAFEVAGSHVQWLLAEEGGQAREALGRIVEGCKALSFKLARRRPFEADPAILALATAWDEAMARLDDLAS
jgi:Domain of unknown function (DUF1839)